MPAKPSLDRVQTWVQEFIVDPAEDEPVFRSNGETADALILPSRTLSPVQRVGIYRDMYLMRMNEALRSDFPALEHFLGDETFAALVKAYVQAFPSRSYTLSRLRDQLPGFILSVPGIARRAFAHDLARLELAMCEVFDAAESTPLEPHAFANALQGGPESSDWENVRFRLIDALRVLSCRYPVNEYLQSVKEEKPHPQGRRKDSWLAVYRREYTVWRLPLSGQAFRMLDALTRGQSLGEAIRSAGRGRAPYEEQVFKWFHRWVAEGLFAAIERD